MGSTVCNGVEDDTCRGDEENCNNCSGSSFLCDNGRCIQARWVCDGFDECRDNSDEKDCNTCAIAEEQGRTFKCQRTSNCIRPDQVCDGVVNCWGGDDEEKCSEKDGTNASNPMLLPPKPSLPEASSSTQSFGATEIFCIVFAAIAVA